MEFFWLVLVTVIALHSTVALDPCNSASLVDETSRAVRSPPSTSPLCDAARFDPHTWYSFRIEGKPATIPTVCVKNNQCGTEVGMRVHLEGQMLPSITGENMTATLCGSYSVLGKYDCCVLRSFVEITRCDEDRLVYKFPKPFDRCPVAVCIIEQETDIPGQAIVKHGETIREMTSEETVAEDVFEDEPVPTSDKPEGYSHYTEKALSTMINELQQSSISVPNTPASDVPSTFESSRENQTSSEASQSTTDLNAVSEHAHSTPTPTPDDFSTTNSTELQALLVNSSSLTSTGVSPQQADLDTTSDYFATGITTVEQVMDETGSTISAPIQTGEMTSDTFSSTEPGSTTQKSLIMDPFIGNTSLSSAEHTNRTDLVNSTTFVTATNGSVTEPVSSDSISTTLGITPGQYITSEETTTRDDLRSDSESPGQVSTSEQPSLQMNSTVSGHVNSTQVTSKEMTTDSSTQESTTPIMPPPPSFASSSRAPTTTATTTSSTINSTTADFTTSQPATEDPISTPQTSSSSSSFTHEEPSSETSSSSFPTSLPPSENTSTSSMTFSSSSSPPLSTPSFHEDLVMKEEMRLVFHGCYENDTLFVKQVENTLTKFLLAVTRLQKSKSGSDWWFQLDVIHQPEVVYNQSTLLDFTVRHTSGKEILEMFEKYKLKKFFREKVHLDLLAACRPSENCQEAGPLSASTNGKSQFWSDHAPVFITVLVLCAVVFLVVMITLLGGKCRDWFWRTGTYNASRDDYQDVKPLSEKTKLRPVSGVSGGVSGLVSGGLPSPFSDEFITREETGLHVTHTEQDSETHNVEEDTWVIPLEDAPSHHRNGHAGQLTTSSSTPPTGNSTQTATTTVHGRNDAFISTRF